jgi:hypothetical protein
MSGGGTMLCEAGRTITSRYIFPTARWRADWQSYAALDAWAVRAFNELGIPASYREINDIISPRGKIAGAAQARRKGFVLHHTTIAHSMDPLLLPRLIRIGRERVSERGVRSADKAVSPLSCLRHWLCRDHSHPSDPSPATSTLARVSCRWTSWSRGSSRSVEIRTPVWINRLLSRRATSLARRRPAPGIAARARDSDP